MRCQFPAAAIRSRGVALSGHPEHSAEARAARVAGLALLLSLLPISNASWAEHGVHFGDDLPVVLSASRLRQPIAESPAAITLITREMIEASGARSIVDLLHLVPGFQIGHRTRGNPVATYHGIADRYNPRLQLLIDGRPTYVPIYGGIPWSELPITIDEIERIEVTRAPNAATFGPNSFRAVISITTRAPGDRPGSRASLEAGGNRYASGTVSTDGIRGDIQYRLTLQAENDEGYRNLPDTERDRRINARFGWQIDVNDRLGLDVGGVHGGRVELEPVEVPEQFAPYQRTDNAYLQLVWERARAVDDEWRASYQYGRYEIEDTGLYLISEVQLAEGEVVSLPPFEVELDRNVRSERHEIEVQRTRSLGTLTRLVFGGALRHDIVGGRYLFGDERDRSVDTRRVFAHAEVRTARSVTLNAGVLVEHTSLSPTLATPRASVLVKVVPNGVARLGWSRGVRSPLLLEEEGLVTLDYRFDEAVVTDVFIVDRGDIDPERIDVLDIGWYQRFPSIGLSVDARLSRQFLKGLVGTGRLELPEDTFDGEARAFSNRDDYRYDNAELQLDWRPARHMHFRLGWSNPFGEDGLLERRRLVPRHTLSVFGSIRLGAETTLSAEYYHTSGWIWDDVRAVSRLDRLDLRVARGFRIGKLGVELALQAELAPGKNVDYLERNEVQSEYFTRLSMRLP